MLKHIWNMASGCCCCSVTKLCLTLWDPWTAASQVPLCFTISWSLFKYMSIGSVMPSNHLILCHPLLLLPSIFPSIRGFSHESVHIRRPKYWNFSFGNNPSNEFSGLIYFRIVCFDLLAAQGTLPALFWDCSWSSTVGKLPCCSK